MNNKKRTENSYRSVQAKDGTFSPHLGRTITERLTRYCKNLNINRTRFVEQCIAERLDELEDVYLQSLTKEELIEIIKHK